MTEVQHVYEGEGSPIDLGIQAPKGSHYIDVNRSDHAWVATFHDPNPEQPSTEWLKLEERYLPYISDSAGWMINIPVGGRAEGVLAVENGYVDMQGTGTVFSNVELVADGNGGLRYSGTGPFVFQAVDSTDGRVIFTVTPLGSYDIGAA